MIEHSLIVKLADRIHCLMHAVIADADMIRQLKHLTGLAFRSSADKTDFLIFSLFLIIRFPFGRRCTIQELFLFLTDILEFSEIPGILIPVVSVFSFIVIHGNRVLLSLDTGFEHSTTIYIGMRDCLAFARISRFSHYIRILSNMQLQRINPARTTVHTGFASIPSGYFQR